MQVKQIAPMNVLYTQKRTTIPQLFQYVRVVARQLYEVAYEAGLEITGPVYWMYEGMDGKPETIFTLRIALPVHQCKPVSGEFSCERLEPFACAYALHTGTWETLPQTYEKLIKQISSNGQQMNGSCREVYIHMDFEHPQNSLTEVRIGIQG